MKGEVGQVRILRSSSGILGELASLPAPVNTENWTGAIFAQSYLMQAHWVLSTQHELRLPEVSKGYAIKLCRLDELGSLGYDVRDIFDAFAVDKTATTWSPHPGFWNHDADLVRTIAQKPNATLLARTQALPTRRLKDAKTVWSKAGRILLVSRLRTNTHRVIATGFVKKVLGNTWWSFDDSSLTKDQRKALLMWLNSTLGILSYYGRRAITQGAWMQMKKPAWASMAVLDVRELSSAKLASLVVVYDSVSKKDLAPISLLDTDSTRKEIDKALCKALGLPDLAPIRVLLSREPGLSAHDIAPGAAGEEASDQDVEP